MKESITESARKREEGAGKDKKNPAPTPAIKTPTPPQVMDPSAPPDSEKKKPKKSNLLPLLLQ